MKNDIQHGYGHWKLVSLCHVNFEIGIQSQYRGCVSEEPPHGPQFNTLAIQNGAAKQRLYATENWKSEFRKSQRIY